MLLGKTGSGKTYAAFQAAMSALALGEYVSAIDIKGREWIQLTAACEAKVITFDERNPSFVNTLRLDDLEANAGNANELFQSAVREPSCYSCWRSISSPMRGTLTMRRW